MNEMAMIRGWASQPSRRGIMPRLALRDKSLVQVAAIVVLLFAVTACAPRYSGPPFARNDTDRTGIVRVVGTNGRVDFVVPPHSSVMISVPTTIGAVTAEWLFFDDCSSGVHSFDGPIQGSSHFAFLTGDTVEYGSDSTPPPDIQDAVSTTACENVTPP